MALNVFHCTVSNDVSHIAADITQFEVCFPIVEQFVGMTIRVILFVGILSPKCLPILKLPKNMSCSIQGKCLKYLSNSNQMATLHQLVLTMWDSVRTVTMIGSRHIPRNLAIGNYNDKIVYAGHPAECNLCGKGYHIS